MNEIRHPVQLSSGIPTGPSRRYLWITGARGFIGQHLARHCARLGYQVCGIGHGVWAPIEAERSGVTKWINGDVTGSNLQALRSRSGLPVAVFHLAGGSSVAAAIAQPREDFSRTVSSTVALLEWVRQESPATRVVAVSSAAVYGSGHNGRISETAAATPYSPYGYHKLMMESLCRSYGATYGINSIIARLFSVYGEGLRKQLLWDVCCMLAGSESVIELGGDGEELRDWVNVSDAVSVLESLAARAGAQVPALNVGTGVGTSVAQIANLLVEAWGNSTGQRRHVRFSGNARAGDPRSLVAYPGLLTEHGVRCGIAVAPGIAAFVHWFRTESGAAS